MYPLQLKFRPLPAPHQSVAIAERLEEWRDGMRAHIVYRGSPDALVAAGVATREMVLPGGKGRHRTDPMGRRFRRHVYRRGEVHIRYDLPRHEAAGLSFVDDPLAWAYRLLPISEAQREAFAREAELEGDDHADIR